jgi:hypothetical protein
MLDTRPWIYEQLQTVNPNVKMGNPEGDVDLPIICYEEVSEMPEGHKGYVLLTYNISVYTGSFSSLISMVNSVDDLMAGTLGFERIGITSDSDARQDTDLYYKAMIYRALVNTQTLIITPADSI